MLLTNAEKSRMAEMATKKNRYTSANVFDIKGKEIIQKAL